MAAKVSDNDAYYKLYKALHLLTYEALPAVDNALKVWHSNNKPMLPSCTGHCPNGKKPRMPASCQSCVDWGNALDAAFYPPPIPPAKPQLTWQNIIQSNITTNHIEVAKAFVLRLPKKKASPRSNQYASIYDFDTASVLMIMARFRGFHGGNRDSYVKIKKVSEIRNELSHLRLQRNMLLDDQMVKEYFQDIEALVKCLSQLHPQHFTSAQDVRAKLRAIQMETITSQMKDEINLELRDDMARFKAAIDKQIKDNVQSFDMAQCQNQLKADYQTDRAGINFLPGTPKNFSLEEFFVDVSLVQEEERPTEVIQKELVEYTDLLTLESRSGGQLGHVLVRGEAGTGKTTLVNRLAYQWAVNLNNIDNDASPNPLSKFDLVFALNIRNMKFGTNLVDCIQDQLLPEVDTGAIKNILINYGERCLFLLDGYDELKSHKRGGPLLSSKFLHRGFVIVTTRPDKVDHFCRRYNGYAHVRLTGFSDESKRAFISKYFATASDEYSTGIEPRDKGESILRKLNSYLESLSCFPLLLAMMCSIFNKSKKIPLRITALYREVVDTFASQYYTKTSRLTSLTDAQLWKKDDVLLLSGSTALNGLLIDDEKLIFNKEDFEVQTLSQLSRRHFWISLSCYCLCGCMGFELGLISNSSYLKLMLTVVGISIGYILVHFLIRDDTIYMADKLGILTKVHNNQSLQYSFLHKTFQEFAAARYWSSLATRDRRKFEYYLNKINKENVESMQYLLRFCCGLSMKAAQVVLEHVVNICDVDWRLPLTLLFEAETDSEIHPQLHGILFPLKSLDIPAVMSPELWSILHHYAGHKTGTDKGETWLSSIEKLFIHVHEGNLIEYNQFIQSCSEMVYTNNLKLFQVRVDCFLQEITVKRLTKFLSRQLDLRHFALIDCFQNVPNWGEVLKIPIKTPVRTGFYVEHLISSLESLSLVGIVIPKDCRDMLLNTFTKADNRLRQQTIMYESTGDVAHGPSLPLRKFDISRSNIIIDNRRADNRKDSISYKVQEVLSLMPNLEYLGLSSCNVTALMLRVLASAISRMLNLQVLKLGNQIVGANLGLNDLHQAGQVLSQILQNTINLTELDLCKTSLHDDDIGALSLDHLRGLSKLGKLDLSWNRFGSQGLIYLSVSLKHMPMLTELNLSRNRVCKQGVAALIECFPCISSLTYLSLSPTGEDSFEILAQSFKLIPKLQHVDLSGTDAISIKALEITFNNLVFLPQLREFNRPQIGRGIRNSALLQRCIQEVPELRIKYPILLDQRKIKQIVRISKSLNDV